MSTTNAATSFLKAKILRGLDVSADESITKLELACSVTDKSGQVITGQRYPELGNHLQPISAGASFSCKFNFQGCLQPGCIFNAGAWNCPERLYLHQLSMVVP